MVEVLVDRLCEEFAFLLDREPAAGDGFRERPVLVVFLRSLQEPAVDGRQAFGVTFGQDGEVVRVARAVPGDGPRRDVLLLADRSGLRPPSPRFVAGERRG